MPAMVAVNLLPWLLLLSGWTGQSASLDSFTPDGVKIYDVVRPIRLHDRHRRDLESSRPQEVKYAMRLGGKDIEMHLQKNNDFLTHDYAETFYLDDGTPVTTKPDNLDLCYYHGRIVNDSSSMISVSTCDGLRGYIQTAEQRFLIEPQSPDGNHTVVKYEDVSDTPAVCGVTNTTWDLEVDGLPRTSKSRSRASGLTMLQRNKYNELFLVADNRMFLKVDSDVSKVRSRIFEIINFVNMVYKPLNTFVAVTGLEVWTDADKITVTAPAGETLDKFTKYRNEVLMKRKKHDNAHLLTGIDFEGATVGLAFIGTLCTGHSTGVIQDHNPRVIAVGATLAHEMGHNLGMSHDTSSCVCSEASCIMAGALSYTIPQYFSSCSIANFETYLNTRNPECLLNKPRPEDLLMPAVCGNGFRENGEKCDCGSVQECTNPCCNATTCEFTKGSQCAEGECCQDCKIFDDTHMCRAKVDECDLPEYCTGKSNFCPEDLFMVNGEPCKSGKGYCFNGQCPQKEEQCIKMWGAGAVVGSDYCFNQNTRGLYYAYCSRPTNDQYIGCQKQDVMCGKLFCESIQSEPNYGRFLSFGKCKATFYGDRENDFGQVDAGTKCGDGKVCSQNQCVTLEDAYKATNCSAKCQGNGVCNHKLECSCEPGWLPPDCKRSSKTNTAPTGVIIGICMGISILIGACLVGVGVFFKKRRKSGQQQTRQQSQVPVSQFSQPRANPPQQSTFTGIRPKGPPPPPPAVKPSAPPSTLQTDFRTAKKALRPVPPPPKV